MKLSHFKAVILAGGKGTRLYPITKEIPKPLLPVKRKPILNYLIDLFCSFGIKDIAVLINKDFREDLTGGKKDIFQKIKLKLLKRKNLLEPLVVFGF